MANIKFDGPEPKIEPPRKRLKKNHYIDDEAEEVKDEEIEEVKDHSDEFPYEEKDQVVGKLCLTDDEYIALLLCTGFNW